MAMKLHMVQLGTPRKRGEGLRIGAVRFLPRGVRKQDYAKLDVFDVWLPVVAPSRSLVNRLRKSNLAWDKFVAAYRREMAKTDARQAIELIARVAQHTPVSVGCYCEDPRHCHRSVLEKLIRQAGRR